MTLLCRETSAFAQQKWPGGTLYHYGLCEFAQRQAILVRKDIPSDRAIKSDRAKVVMTVGCISETADIATLISDIKKDSQFDKTEFEYEKRAYKSYKHRMLSVSKYY